MKTISKLWRPSPDELLELPRRGTVIFWYMYLIISSALVTGALLYPFIGWWCLAYMPLASSVVVMATAILAYFWHERARPRPHYCWVDHRDGGYWEKGKGP
jgi:hypothetical protein